VLGYLVRCVVCNASHPIPFEAAKDPTKIPEHTPQSWKFSQQGGVFWAACSNACYRKATPELVTERYEARVARAKRSGSRR
jgi:hypothetical protein